MSLPARRIPRNPTEDVEALLETTDRNSNSADASRKEGRRRGWQTQPFDLIATSLNQSHFVLNLFSIVFFCVGCLLLIISSHQQGIKLIMPDCHSETTITQNTNKIVQGGDFYEEKDTKTGDPIKGSTQFLVASTQGTTSKKVINLGGLPQPSKVNSGGKQLVEFVIAGNEVPAVEAVRLDYAYAPIEHVQYEQLEIKESEDMEMGEKSGIKFFIAVMSRCCTKKSREGREAIRQTWKAHALSTYDNVDIKFFLSQPDLANAEESGRMLVEELAERDDIVMLRGHDLYENLPNKTFGILKYALSSPKKYTHVLKTDDDCYVRVHKLMEILNPPEGPMMEGMYKGCMENRGGFYPIRDPNSKWYLRYDELDDYTAQPIRGTKYLAGWGYILTRDLVFHAMKKVYNWDNKLENVPAWYPIMKWEDVMMGILMSDKVSYPDADYHFKAAWRACTNETAIRHLDLDAPSLLYGLYQQEMSGLWLKKTVQCSSGNYVAGDYGGWKRWRNSVTEAESRI